MQTDFTTILGLALLNSSTSWLSTLPRDLLMACQKVISTGSSARLTVAPQTMTKAKIARTIDAIYARRVLGTLFTQLLFFRRRKNYISEVGHLIQNTQKSCSRFLTKNEATNLNIYGQRSLVQGMKYQTYWCGIGGNFKN